MGEPSTRINENMGTSFEFGLYLIIYKTFTPFLELPFVLWEAGYAVG